MEYYEDGKKHRTIGLYSMVNRKYFQNRKKNACQVKTNMTKFKRFMKEGLVFLYT